LNTGGVLRPVTTLGQLTAYNSPDARQESHGSWTRQVNSIVWAGRRFNNVGVVEYLWDDMTRHERFDSYPALTTPRLMPEMSNAIWTGSN